jgi:hypothetical protein
MFVGSGERCVWLRGWRWRMGEKEIKGVKISIANVPKENLGDLEVEFGRKIHHSVPKSWNLRVDEPA